MKERVREYGEVSKNKEIYVIKVIFPIFYASILKHIIFIDMFFCKGG